MEEIVIQPSEELAYWIGLVQADGSLLKWTRKSGKHETELHMETSSEILIKEFQRGLAFINRFPKYFRTKRNFFTCKALVGSILPILNSINLFFSKHDFNPPDFIHNDEILFGAYLAGVIDGDGDVRVKGKKCPQCIIRITSGFRQYKLTELIKKFMKCSVLNTERQSKKYSVKYNRVIKGSWSELEFSISSKNFAFILNYILPKIKLNYKKEKITNFIKEHYAVGGI